MLCISSQPGDRSVPAAPPFFSVWRACARARAPHEQEDVSALAGVKFLLKNWFEIASAKVSNMAGEKLLGS